jgi:hypothetical protein
MLLRRLAILIAAASMMVLMGALAGVALAAPGPPTVVSTVPPNGATDVSTTANINAKFSEEKKEKSINTNTFYLEVDSAPCPACVTTTTSVPATVRYNDDTKTAVLNPTDPLAPNTTYTATVGGTGDGDMQAVKDEGGKPMASDFIFSFTTSGCGLR